MQIIIVQSEIEEAIRDHILEKVTVEDDMVIDIDLKATRGSEGYQAIIEIRQKNSPRRSVTIEEDEEEGNASSPITSESSGTLEQSVTTTRAPQAPGSVSDPSSGIVPGRRRRRTKAEMEEARRLEAAGGTPTAAEDTATADAILDNEPEEAIDEAQAPLTGSDEDVAEEDAETALDAAPEATVEEAPPAPRTSIFANLNKPVNEKTDA